MHELKIHASLTVISDASLKVVTNFTERVLNRHVLGIFHDFVFG